MIPARDRAPHDDVVVVDVLEPEHGDEHAERSPARRRARRRAGGTDGGRTSASSETVVGTVPSNSRRWAGTSTRMPLGVMIISLGSTR